MIAERRNRITALAFILLIALALRLDGIGFGLPSLYDPDEPIFMVKALELLTNGTLNPKWFGHPGTTTIYLVALIDLTIIAGGFITGAWHSVGEFTKAAFGHPELLFLPARIAMTLLGVISVGLTYVVGRRLQGTAVGLVAAALLAINALHIAWSQVVRTDIHASVFMLASLFFALRVAAHGRLKDYVLAGLFAGFAVATKWPSAAVLVAVLGAALSRARGSRAVIRREVSGVAIAVIAMVAGLFIASPYIFLDWPTVLANLSNEARPQHLAHTGHGGIANGWWYLWHPVRDSVGSLGLILILGGIAVAASRSVIARWTLLPTALTFFVMISAQHLIWSRWVLPLLPLLMIFAAAAIVAVAEAIALRFRVTRPNVLIIGAAAVAAIPSIAAAVGGAAERANDTRMQARHWAIAHIPPGSSVVLEHLELSLRNQPWRILFPVGDAGCVDAKAMLKSGVNYQRVERLRRGSPIVDLGTVNPARLDSCRADYAILTYYDLYRAERTAFPNEFTNYRKLLAGGRTLALFEPRRGHAGGPQVRVVALRPH